MENIQPKLNPILVKELRSRMRGGRAFILLTSALLILGLFSFGLYQLVLATSGYNPAPISPQVGQVLFAGLVYLELIIISLITPTLTAGAISEEKERLTYEMLMATPLHPVKVLSGKIISALSFVYLLIFAAIPLVSLVFVFGGVATRDIIKAFIILSITTLTFGVIGIFFSAILGRTIRAMIATYSVIVLLTLGPPLLTMGITLINPSQPPPRWVLVPSSLSALTSAISPSLDPQTFLSRFWMLSGPWSSLGVPPFSLYSIPRPIYHYTLPLYGFITILLYIVSTRYVLPIHRWRINWYEAVVGVVIFLGFFAMVSAGYFMTTHRYENIQLSPETPPNQIEEVNPDSPDKGYEIDSTVIFRYHHTPTGNNPETLAWAYINQKYLYLDD
jgi:ABC-2 type transport system permease protein